MGINKFESKSGIAEEKVSRFYNNEGWVIREGVTEDARQFEDLRDCAANYISRCRLRILRHIPEVGEKLIDMASGPIQYPEYLTYSHNFNKRYCVDLSQDALDKAKELIGEHGVFLCGSFFDLDIENDFFDCSLSLHTIYHMDREMQAVAVRKLIRITKKDKPVIIIYSNPNSLFSRFSEIIRKVRRQTNKERPLYFYVHNLSWWKQFNDVADVKIFPWRTFGTDIQKKIFPNNFIGKQMFKILFSLEDIFPRFFTRIGLYPMIVLTKK